MKYARLAKSGKDMQLMDHLRELRSRLMIVAAVLLTAATLAYIFRQPILDVLLVPLQGQKLIYINPAGGFNFILLISLYTGLAIASPVLLQQLYGFVRPVLPSTVRHYSVRLFIGSILLLIAGASFGYFYAIPGALHFLYTFAEPYITASLTADSYLNFIVAYTIGLGIVFQLPLLMLIIHWIKPQKPGNLLRKERWVILIAFIVAAIITPTPDPINQTIIALPIIAIYQIGIILIALASRSTKPQLSEKLIDVPEEVLQTTDYGTLVAKEPQVERATVATRPAPARIVIAERKAPPARSIDGFRARRPSNLTSDAP